MLREAGLETDGRSSGHCEAMPPGGLAVEDQSLVGFGEMQMRADLNRPVAGVLDPQRNGQATRVEFDVTGAVPDFPGTTRPPESIVGVRESGCAR